MDFKIDWLTLTLKPERSDVKYKDSLSLDMDDLVLEMCPLEKWTFEFLKLIKIKPDFRFKCGNVQHYNFLYSYNGIDIAFANSEHFAEQGLMIRFSAQGIAYYEQYRKYYDKDWNWISFLKEFFSLGVYGLKCKCTRIDLAYDEISYDDNRLISLDRINKAIKHGEAVSLFHKRKPLDKCESKLEISRVRELNSKGDLIGETINFGNRKSATFLRFYDKLREQLNAKHDIDDKIKHWVRMEFEFKQNRAMAVCDSLMLLSAEDFGKYFAQVVNRYLRFVKPDGDRKHYYRCKSRKWWLDIVGTVEKARLTENKAVRNRYNSSLRWLRKNVFPTLYAVLNCMSIDKFLTELKNAGGEQLKRKHEEIIKDYISDKVDETRKGVENHKVSTDIEAFEKLVTELEKTAHLNTMKAAGKDLCEILGMEREYDAFFNPHIEGMLNKDITEYNNRQMCLYYELKDIDDTFNTLLEVF